MEEPPWHLVDPDRTLRDIQARCPFQVDHVIVAAIELGTQYVAQARIVAFGDLRHDFPGGSDLVRRLAEEMVPERWATGPEGHGMTHVLVTVVCREGRVIFTARENAWFRAWRYANHFRAAFCGDVYIVTPHGWGGSLDERAGFEPRIRPPVAARATQSVT